MTSVTVEEILTFLKETRISLTIDGEDLIARPSALITPEVVATLTESKRDLIKALRPLSSEAEVFKLAREYFGLDGDQTSPGLVAKWSREFGYISLYNPADGTWHDTNWKDAPEWARRESRKRKELWKAGNRRAFDLSAAEMRKIWEAEHPAPEEGIVEDHPLEKGSE